MVDTKRGFYGSFRTRPLPKQEYLLLRMLQDHYKITDPSDMIVLLLRLLYEVHHLHGGIQGEVWFRQIIETWKDNLTEERVYEL